jgi:hypothetical protein
MQFGIWGPQRTVQGNAIFGFGALGEDTATSGGGISRRGRKRHDIEDEDRRERALKRGFADYVERREQEKFDAETLAKVEAVERRLAQLQTESAALQTELEGLRRKAERARVQKSKARIEKERLLKEQALALAQAQERALMEELEVPHIAYIAYTAIAALEQLH